MTAIEWQDRYRRLFDLHMAGRSWDDHEAEALRGPMTVEAWRRFTEEEQASILRLGHELYQERIK